ncbi:MAG: CoA transferase [Acidobacteria bacterium]|nr:CoA transferase [Acidobacteriota bacterium]
MTTFLHGVRVLDLSRVLAGPLATQILADMGAEVLKVEPPGGDETRSWGPPFKNGISAYFESCNRNKHSLVLDLKKESERDTLMELVAAADVWVDNYPDDVRQRLGLTTTKLSAINPNLVIVNLRSYPSDSPVASERGYDLILQAETGYMSLIGPPEGPPYKVGHAVIDVLTGMMTANACLGALVQKFRSGKGSHLHVSLYQTALFGLVNIASGVLQSGRPTQRYGNAHPNIVPYESFPTKNGPIVIGVGNDAQFKKLCEWLDLPDPYRRLSNSERVAVRESLIAEIVKRTQSLDRVMLIQELKQLNIPAAAIQKPEEALANCQSSVPSSLVAIQTPSGELQRYVANPVVGSGMRQQHSSPPNLGMGGLELANKWRASHR